MPATPKVDNKGDQRNVSQKMLDQKVSPDEAINGKMPWKK